MSYDELTWGRFNKGNNEALASAVHCLTKSFTRPSSCETTAITWY